MQSFPCKGAPYSRKRRGRVRIHEVPCVVPTSGASSHGQSVGEGVQPQGRRVLLRPEPQVLNARGFTVQAWQGAGGLQDGGGPDLLSVGQRLVIGLTVQGA